MAAKGEYKKELEAIATVLDAVGPLEGASQQFVLRTAIERLGITTVLAPGVSRTSGGAGSDTSHTPTGAGVIGARPRDVKAFLKEKKPVNEVQRVAVLAYYLDRFGDNAEFKTPDLVALNQAAGGVKIGNPPRAVDNATRRSGYLVAINGGKKKISAHGEDVVDALPDQAKVGEVEAAFAGPGRRTKRKAPGKKATK